MKMNIPDKLIYGGLGFLLYKYKNQVNNFACQYSNYLGKKRKTKDFAVVDIMGDVIE